MQSSYNSNHETLQSCTQKQPFWALYDELIDAIPASIEVIDYCIGAHWVYVEAACGMGISHALSAGAHEGFNKDAREFDLRNLAQFAKSWNFVEAAIGVAALNAWHSSVQHVEALGGAIDFDRAETNDASNPFKALAEQYRGKNVAVVGHFPNVETMRKIARVSVLERNCTSSLDIPDSACEALLPEQDFVFMTGTTLINKTIVRLLELSKHAYCGVVGPSTLPHEAYFERGVNLLGGSVVVDHDAAKLSIKGGTKRQWRSGIKKFHIERV